MAGGDQAAGLRRWAEQFGPVGDVQVSMEAAAPTERTVEPVTLLVIGVPGLPSNQIRRVQATLARWQANGHRWVGDLTRWKVVALEADSPHLAVLASQQSRWALWVEGDADGFRRVYRTLRRLREQGGPQRLLVLHDGIASHAGLLRNLQQAAAGFLDTELLLLPEQPEGPC
ncbi:hypothetical protein SAMN05216201_10875 [Pseudomonas linyingensis]|uniref:Uncharacterized protein n=1 Tax=Pseudomonas linyingensis TaxID=915471 RepID=A0A1H6YK86_9PSED|nr:hypothetical protein [Pseudomonas linyingensis]SEJ40806.1 hypothetical protein SAMN05216201_10875 [Pseudomonas linyingensis]